MPNFHCLPFAAFLCLATMAQAQNASAPLTIVVPYQAGGALDNATRLLAEVAKPQMGDIAVLNKPGAGGNLGADMVAKAPLNGNLLVMGSVGTHASNPWLYKNFPYDPTKDFKPVLLVGRAPAVLLMNAEQATRLGIRTTTDLVAYIKKHPDQLKGGSGGRGSISHIAAEMFRILTNTKVAYVQFDSIGSAEALKALQANEMTLVFDSVASSLGLIKSGKLVALGVTSLGRIEALPHVPSINDEVPGFNVVTWFGLFAPATLPDSDAQRYAAAFTQAMHSPIGRERFKKIGITLEDLNLDAFGRFQQSELRKYSFLIKATKIRID
nr:tripartite tricarboxylate transporter substrate binding protein [uncultured Rhodoferax sp.]